MHLCFFLSDPFHILKIHSPLVMQSLYRFRPSVIRLNAMRPSVKKKITGCFWVGAIQKKEQLELILNKVHAWMDCLLSPHWHAGKAEAQEMGEGLFILNFWACLYWRDVWWSVFISWLITVCTEPQLHSRQFTLQPSCGPNLHLPLSPLHYSPSCNSQANLSTFIPFCEVVYVTSLVSPVSLLPAWKQNSRFRCSSTISSLRSSISDFYTQWDCELWGHTDRVLFLTLLSAGFVTLGKLTHHCKTQFLCAPSGKYIEDKL